MPGGKLIHVRIPVGLVEEIDRLAEGRSRGAVITAALEEFIRVRRLVRAINQGRGLLSADQGVWQTDADVDRWVQTLRSGWEPPGR